MTSPSPSAPRGFRARTAVVVGALALALAAGSRAEGPSAADAADVLGEAKFQWLTLKKADAALELLKKVLPATDASPRVRGDAFLLAAVCAHELGHHDDEAKYVDQILGDVSLPADVRLEAQRMYDRRKTEDTEQDKTRLQEEAERKAREAAARASQDQSRAYTEQARSEFAQGRSQRAYVLALQAEIADPDNQEAAALKKEIEAALPDRGALIHQILEILYTSRGEEYQRLKDQADAAIVEAKRTFGQGNMEAADKALRTAIEEIDRSEFLVDLADQRRSLLGWLRQVAEKAAEKGVRLAPEPPLPDPSARQTGLRGELFQALGKLFRIGGERDEPLKIYDAAPSAWTGARPGRTLGPSTFGGGGGIATSLGTGSLSRARWAERWIREYIEPGTWTDPDAPRPEGMSRHLLVRHEDVLVVQHVERVQDRVSDLLSSFSPTTTPSQVDVAVFAALPGGTVRVAELLRARAAPAESGLELVISGRLFEECVKELQEQERTLLGLLGTARVHLRGETSARLELTQRTEKSPVNQGLTPPALRVAEAEARYGLWLDLYAEAMPHATGAPSAAVAVRALARWPTGSVVVPKPNRDGPWTRVATFGERTIETQRRVPNVGTLVLFAGPNPFTPSGETQRDLVILVGVRPGAVDGGPAPTPDPPRSSGLPGAEPEGAVDRSHLLGALATEVVDDVVVEGWPQRPSTVAAPHATAADNRAVSLAQWIAEQTGLFQADKPNPVTVRDGAAWAHVTPEQHERIAAAAQRLREQEATLYDVDVIAVETTMDRAGAWSGAKGVTKLGDGRYRLDAEAAEAIDAQMRSAPEVASLYAMQQTTTARATQRKALQTLRVRTIVQDVRTRAAADGTPRYLPLTGPLEEGLIVEVRPGVEEAGGRRPVSVRMRATTVRSIEPVQMTGTPGRGPKVQLPRYWPLGDVSTATSLADREAILLLLGAPEAPKERAVAVKVTATRLP